MGNKKYEPRLRTSVPVQLYLALKGLEIIEEVYFAKIKNVLHVKQKNLDQTVFTYHKPCLGVCFQASGVVRMKANPAM